MIGGTAGHNAELLHLPKLLIAHSQLLNYNSSILKTGTEGITHRFGLLINLFQHKMLIAALFRRIDIPLNGHGLLLNLLLIDVVEGHGVPRQPDNLLILNVIDASRITQNGRNIGGNQISSL